MKMLSIKSPKLETKITVEVTLDELLYLCEAVGNSDPKMVKQSVADEFTENTTVVGTLYYDHLRDMVIEALSQA